jgi:hypothetical protein
MKDGRKVVGFAVQLIRVNSSPMLSKPEVSARRRDVCFAPMSGRRQDALACPKSAKIGLVHGLAGGKKFGKI